MRMSRNFIKQFEFYKYSINFEYEQERLYHEIFSINGKSIYFPRAVFYHNFINKYHRIINFFFPIIIFSWLLFFQVFYSLFLLIKNIFSVIPLNTKVPKKVYWSLSDSKYFSLISPDVLNYPEAIITFPFKNAKDKYIEGRKEICFLNITNRLILFKAFFKSICFCWFYFFTSERKLMLYTFTAFNWFWVYDTLKRYNISNIWLSNHYDRWVILASSLPNIQVTMVQHGQLEYYDTKSNRYYFPNFTRKVQNVSCIYTINQLSRNYFHKFVDIDSNKFESLNTGLNVVEWREEGKEKIKILIVGHQNELKFHIEIIRLLTNEFALDVDICYKYHPQQINVINDSNIWEFRDSKTLPEPDLVLSYGSSLDEEIKASCSCKLLHYASYDENSKSDFLKKILSFLMNFRN